ncbi:bifunctional (p)ppGpp synthetase/guanosine-3',5'-bis(diphosphate) 3'-pyrophosphohydrolase [Candidatus Kaiserbacteria bacterium]|nr:MAG: bifunctional (p)ppGpp synthetase/guanosine-3',5'-bis(diphosphate) 3'-pyrophosphohydrolase [Candidatus Kaiserbacteria bacterium]
MAYSYAIEQAIKAASVLHKDQVRKGSVPYPYVTHLFAVATIVADYTTDEDTIVAALLHDTLEDTDYTEKELEDDFGGAVRDIVVALTEPPVSDYDRKNIFFQKKEYLKQIKDASERALIVVAADKIHNMRSIVEEYFDDHSSFLSHFGTHIEDRLMVYQEISNVLNRRLKNQILSEFNSVFTEYKNFLHDVEKKRTEY